MWQFSRTLAPLAVLTTDVFHWSYAYQYPVGCLKINRLIPEYERLPTGSTGLIDQRVDSLVLPLKDQRSQVPYEVFNIDSNKVIGTDQSNLHIDYTASVNDPNLFSDDFIMALSHLLSSELAIPIVGGEIGRGLRGESLELYRSYLASAIADDQNDQYFQPGESDFVTIRR